MADNERRILKYHVPIGGEHTIELSIFGDIVHVDQQDDYDEVVFWALHHPMSVTAEYTFQVFGTGHPIPFGWRPMGSVVDNANGSVWHLFVQGVDCRRLP